ncbi:phosphopantetheine-binding protein [Anthocerotibacter panamensis]|uniref:phosphopantetheine-binding protein n=1 Tax=Anthocerotibacter panamensis TaxID=2857077 RepID=UPI001C403BE8|nr:phosphopantetheine-binding protein [Anthocerotibacter panamensis]
MSSEDFTKTNSDRVHSVVISDLEKVFTQAFFEIVSDKTGYPVEVLELDMNLEADLGIDSIKWVEILGAFMEQFPNIPLTLPPEQEIINLRTFRQIIDYLVRQGQEAVEAQSASAASKLATDLSRRLTMLRMNTLRQRGKTLDES